MFIYKITLIMNKYFKIILVAFLLFLTSSKGFSQTEEVSIIRQDCSGYSNCYTSLFDWSDDFGGINFGDHEQGDLVSADIIAIARIEGTWTEPDTNAISISGWNTDEDHYIRIYTTPEARHNGTAGSGYRCSRIYSNAAYLRIEGLEVYSENSSCIYLRPETDEGIGEIHISHNLVHGDGVNTTHGIYNYTCRGTVKIWNNFIYDVASLGYNGAIQSDRGTAYIYNNTIGNTIAGYGIRVSGTAYAKNNLCNATNHDFNGAFYPGSDYNASSDDTAPGFNSLENQTFTFVDSTNKDFHLASSNNGASNLGIDLSEDTNIPFSDDIDGDTRPDGWDIGADENLSVPDNSPPGRSDGAPSGTLVAGTTQATLSLLTSENTICRFSLSPDIAYTEMTSTFSNTGGTFHSHTVTGLHGEQTYTYYIKCQDEDGNANTDDYIISFYIESSDVIFPVISNVQTVNVTPYSVTISWETDENTTSQVEYGFDSSYGFFTVTDMNRTMYHSVSLTGLESEQVYHYRVRSRDIAHNETISADYIFTTPRSNGNTYYVDQNNDLANNINPGTQAQPWVTVQHAADVMEPGDMVVVYPGNYGRIDISRSGTPDSCITFRGLNTPNQSHIDQNELFDPANPSAFPGNTDDNAVTRGFTLALPWASEDRIQYIRIENFEITDIAESIGSGIYLRGTDHIQIVRNLIHDLNSARDYAYIGIRGVSHKNSNILVKDNTLYRVQGTGINIVGQNWIVEGNELSHGLDANSNDGRHVGGDSDAFRFFGSGHIIRNNYAHDYLDTEQYGDPHIDCFQVFSVYPESQFANDILIECNTCENMGQMLMAEDQGEEETGENAVHHITFRNNVFRGARAGSILLGGYIDYVTFVNNVIADGYYTALSVSNHSHHLTVLNNIFYKTGSTQLSNETCWEGSEWDYNIHYPDFTYPPKQPLFDVHSLFGVNPLFVDSLAGDYHLQENSPAIDIGIERSEFNYDKNKDIRPSGSGWDIGAYEYIDPNGSEDDDSNIVRKMILYQNYPNPFNTETIFIYELSKASTIIISLYDITGKKVRTFYSGRQSEGPHSVQLNGIGLSSGIYFFRILGKNFTAVKKCLLVK